jgi:Uma2 family endonuclease
MERNTRQENKLCSVTEYLRFERSSEEKHEYINGFVIPMAGASREHNLITGNIASELRIQLKGKACESKDYSNKLCVSRRSHSLRRT